MKHRRKPSRTGGPALFACAALALVGLAASSSGCATPAHARPSTRFTVDDFNAMTAHMAQSLLASDAIAARGPDSEPWVVSIQDVENLSSDVIPEREQWAIMHQVRGAQPIHALATTKNIRFVLPADRVRQMQESGDILEFSDDEFAAARNPTHVMTATFRSVTRGEAQGDVRTDAYFTEFEILELATNEPLWHDRFEFKRQARGQIWD